VIAPGSDRIYDTNNCLVIDEYVYDEVSDLLTTGDIIGIVYMDNISVPTSIYMYASFGIPVIGFDCNPVNTIILENEIGEIFNNERDFGISLKKIKLNYSVYKEKTEEFILTSSWKKSASKHRSVFQ
jgi:hypothetical protein